MATPNLPPFIRPGGSPPPTPFEPPKQQGLPRPTKQPDLFGRERLAREAEAARRGEARHTESLITLATLLPIPERHRVVDALVRSFGTEDLPLRVEKTEGVAGGDACLVRTRIPVWTLESYRRQGATEEEILVNFPTLRRPDLLSAWIYVSGFRKEIEEAMRANEEDD